MNQLNYIYNPYKKSTALEQKCIPKAIMSYFAGGAMGIVMAAFMSAMQFRQIDIGKSKKSTRYVLKKDLRRILNSGKGFAVFGGFFVLFECMIEHVRCKEDGVNSFLAGGATSMILAANISLQTRQIFYSGLSGGVMCMVFFKIFKMLGY